MGRLVRLGAPDALADFYDSPSHIFGSGEDSSVTISANTTLTEDKYYLDLTVDAAKTLNTAGYRVFVQRHLYLYGTIGMTAGPSAQGSLGIGSQSAAVTNSLGGASTSHTVTVPTAALGGTQWYKNPLNAVDGYSFDPATGTVNLLKGGAGDGTNYGGGVVVVCARYLFGDGNVSATGSGNAGGGVLFLISSDKSHSYTLSAAGAGTGSAGNAYFLEAD
jgi:hypothetical protein